MLAAVLETSACQADVGALLSGCAVGLPAKDGKRSRADLALSTIVLLEHLYIRVVRQALFADGREIGRLPPATVQVGLDLGRHDGGGMRRLP